MRKRHYTEDERKLIAMMLFKNLSDEDRDLALKGKPHLITFNQYRVRHIKSPVAKAVDTLRMEHPELADGKTYHALKHSMLKFFFTLYTGGSLARKPRSAGPDRALADSQSDADDG
jgi:hypothetical protein